MKAVATIDAVNNLKGSHLRLGTVAKIAFGVFLLAIMTVQIAGGVLAMRHPDPVRSFGSDLRLRHSESRCAHQGVNSFRIWNHDMTLPGFKPFPRPDMKTPPANPGDEFVHAYPPWHVALFYFYGWLSWPVCFAVMVAVFGFCLYFVMTETVRIVRLNFPHSEFVAGMSLAMVAFYATECFFVMNYGVLILTMFLLMNRMLERKHDFLAGLCWVVMMIKPQVGVLFIWPLFWHRRYVSILTAVVMCLLLAGVTSVLVHESVIDLILQLPEIGRPYGVHLIVETFVRPVLGNSAAFVWMGLSFATVGVVTCMLRKRSFLICCVPVALAVTLWTYSQWHDRMILIVLMIALFGRMAESRGIDRWSVCGVAFCVVEVVLRVWPVANFFGCVWAERARMFQVFQGLELIVQLTFLVLFVADEVGGSTRGIDRTISDMRLTA